MRWLHREEGYGKTIRPVDFMSAFWRRNVIPSGEMPVSNVEPCLSHFPTFAAKNMFRLQQRHSLDGPFFSCRNYSLKSEWVSPEPVADYPPEYLLFVETKNNHYLRINIQDAEYHLFGRLCSEETFTWQGLNPVQSKDTTICNTAYEDAFWSHARFQCLQCEREYYSENVRRDSRSRPFWRVLFGQQYEDLSSWHWVLSLRRTERRCAVDER